jgi:hypothetical protein
VWLLCHSPKSFLLASVPHHHQAVQVKRSRSTHVRTSSGQPPKHYTIRDLLWLTLLAAVLVAWWVDRRALSRKLDRFQQWYDRNFGVEDKVFGQKSPLR